MTGVDHKGGSARTRAFSCDKGRIKSTGPRGGSNKKPCREERGWPVLERLDRAPPMAVVGTVITAAHRKNDLAGAYLPLERATSTKTTRGWPILAAAAMRTRRREQRGTLCDVGKKAAKQTSRGTRAYSRHAHFICLETSRNRWEPSCGKLARGPIGAEAARS